MNISGKALKQLRQKHKLTINEVAEATSVRAHIIADLENDNDISLPAPYVISFKKSLLAFYESLPKSTILSKKELESEDKTEKIEIGDANFFEETDVDFNLIAPPELSESNKNINTIIPNQPELKIQEEEYLEYEGFEIATNKEQKNLKKENKNTKNKITHTNVVKKTPSTDTNITKEFNKKISPKIKIYITYSVLGLFLVSVIYFVFFFNSTPIDVPDEKKSTALSEEDTTEADKELLSKILESNNAPDSVILTASCLDTAWVKVDIDGNIIDEFVMIPGESKRWAALDYILLNTSKVGNIKFYKNDTLLPRIGAKGSLVKNIKITQEGITNIQPLENNNQPISVDAINTNNEIHPSQPDSTKKIKSTTGKSSGNRKKNKEKQPEIIPILDFSTPPKTKPTGLE